MSELAKLLKSKREELGKTVKMVSQETKIRENSILLMDKGALREMPSYLHAYGFVKQYAESLGYDYEMQIKPLFDTEYPKVGNKAFGVKDGDNSTPDSNGSNGHVKKTAPSDKIEFVEDTEEPTSNSNSNSNIIIIAIIVGLLIVGAISYYVFYSLQNVSSTIVVVERDEAENMSIEYPSPTTNINTLLDETANGTRVPQANDRELTTPPVNNTARGGAQVNDVVPAPTPKRLIFGFKEECWVKYTSDGLPAVEYFGLPGQSKAVYFIDNFTLDIGNAAGLTITYGRQTLDNFGNSGAVRRGLKYKLENDKLVLDVKR